MLKMKGGRQADVVTFRSTSYLYSETFEIIVQLYFSLTCFTFFQTHIRKMSSTTIGQWAVEMA